MNSKLLCVALFATTAFAAEIDISTFTKSYTAKDGDILTGSLNNYGILVEDNATVTLRNMQRNIKEYHAGIACKGNCTLIIEGENHLVGGHGYSGILASPEGKTLTIEGTGSLIAEGGENGAGIGTAAEEVFYEGNEPIQYGNITIKSGTVTAIGGKHAAGIGLGSYKGIEISMGDITISGGNVTATGGSGGAGIGLAMPFFTFTDITCGNITISGGNVIATGGYQAAGIGIGDNLYTYTTCGAITITDGVTQVTATRGNNAQNSIGHGHSMNDITLGTITIGGVETDGVKANPFTYSGKKYMVRFDANGGSGTMPKQKFIYGVPTKLSANTFVRKGFAFAAWNSSADGSGTYYANQTVLQDLANESTEEVTLYAQWVSGNGVDLSSLTEDFVAQDGDVLTGRLDGKYNLSIAPNASVTLAGMYAKGVDGYAGITCLGDCKIILVDYCENTVIGGSHGAGILPGPKGTELIIEGNGTLTVQGKDGGAGIGTGYTAKGAVSECGNITIRGGKISAIGATGIGTGRPDEKAETTCGNIIISGGSISVTGSYNYGTGIGTYFGFEATATCGNITITDGVSIVTATMSHGTNSIGHGSTSIYGVSSVGTITIGGVITGSIGTSPFVYKPSVINTLKGEDGKRYAVINGNYDGPDEVLFEEDETVDAVIFNREFSNAGRSTLALPFDFAVNNVDGISRVMEFDGVDMNSALVYVKYVWCADGAVDKNCPIQNDGKFDAYKPYIIEIADGKSSLAFHGETTFKKTPEDGSDFRLDDWVFRPMLKFKKWESTDPELTGCGINKDKSCVYGYAAEDISEDIKTKGKFVRLAAGAYIYPLRSYMIYEPKTVAQAKAAYLGHPATSAELPDDFSVVVRGENNETTVIGKFNTRTGEFMLYRDHGTFDLKGRNATSRKAKGVYLKK